MRGVDERGDHVDVTGFGREAEWEVIVFADLEIARDEGEGTW